MEVYEEFEKEWESWAKVPNVVGCNSGTAALHLALEALQLPQGSEVIVPDLCMIACPRAVILAGLVPIFVGCGPDLNMRPDMVEAVVTGRTRAILVVHNYGRKCKLTALYAIALRKWLKVVEDRAEIHGANFDGFIPDAACWSFYRNKIIAGEEGGAVSFREKVHAAHARQLRCLGFTEDHDFSHVPRGHNYRLSNAHARLILDSMSIWQRNWLIRRRNEENYNVLCPEDCRMPKRDAPWVYDLRIPGMSTLTQDTLVKDLNKEGIRARHCFKPCSTQLEFQKCKVVGDKAEADKAAKEVIYLPLGPDEVSPRTADKAFELIGRVRDRGRIPP